MDNESAAIARICHDLITPFNAINLGLEAFEMSQDESLLESLKESVNKANVTLKFMRELFSDRPDTFCYSPYSLQQEVSEYLKLYNVKFELKSDMEKIANIAGKIVMYSGVISKEILPFGGELSVIIDNDRSEISAQFCGKNLVIPKISEKEEEDINYKSIMRRKLKELLINSGFSISTCVDTNKDSVVLNMKMK